jgi:hypothetical protein
MKLVKSNGRELEVFEISGPIYRLTASLGPIKANGSFILEDEAARELVRELAAVQNNPEMWTG